jgi:hypothetical protein
MSEKITSKKSVREKFNEFKNEIKEAFESDEFGMLEMSHKTVNDLIRAGYVHRKLESFMYNCEFTQKEISDFFNEECADIDENMTGPLQEKGFSKNVYNYVSEVKYEAVSCKLWHELIDFYLRLKSECINTN